MTRQEVLDILRAHLPEIKKRFGVKRLGIFGSVARDEATEGSDVDIIVEFEETPDLFVFIDLKEYLSDILHAHVDITTPKSLKPWYKKSILSEVIYIEKSSGVPV